MRFGLFGGARTDPGEQASDSRIYTDYIDYICAAEALGFHSVFLALQDIVIEPAPVQKPYPSPARSCRNLPEASAA